MKHSIRQWAALTLMCAAALALSSLLATASDAQVNLACGLIFGLWVAAALTLRFSGRWKPEWSVPTILAGGFSICVIFALKLPYTFSYHDLAAYPEEFSLDELSDGHLGYIAYIVNNGSLPTLNPMEARYSIFYNPPLYHIVQAGFVRLNLLAGLPLPTALENLQIVTLFCAGACMLVTLSILKQLKLNTNGLRAGALLIAFQPMLYIFGATVNNDIMSVLASLICVLYTLKWMETSRMRHIVGIALALGLGMAVKLSVAVLIPCIAIVFIARFFKDIKQWKRYAGQFIAFLLISVPLGTAWSIYQSVAHGMPLNYVRLPGAGLDVSNYTLAQRFGIPDWFAIRGLFFTGVRKTDHNVWMQTLKTGVFDEMILYEEGTAMWYISYLLLVAFAVLLVISLVLFIRMLIIKRDGRGALQKVFLASYGALLIASYFKFCLDYPYICSFNFRYIMPILSLCAVAVGCYRSDTSARRSRWVSAYTALYAGLTLVVYGIYFFVSG